MLTKEEVSKAVLREIEDGLQFILNDIEKPIVKNVDMENKTITIVFSWNEVKIDNYIGLGRY